jgi:nicotinate-nucleotide pyrophosphorylase
MTPGEPEATATNAPVGDAAVVDAVSRALAEDLLADGDLTAALVPAGATAHFALRARQGGVLAGRAPP